MSNPIHIEYITAIVSRLENEKENIHRAILGEDNGDSTAIELAHMARGKIGEAIRNLKAALYEAAK